jgi:hypothetical protein
LNVGYLQETRMQLVHRRSPNGRSDTTRAALSHPVQNKAHFIAAGIEPVDLPDLAPHATLRRGAGAFVNALEARSSSAQEMHSGDPQSEWQGVPNRLIKGHPA